MCFAYTGGEIQHHPDTAEHRGWPGTPWSGKCRCMDLEITELILEDEVKKKKKKGESHNLDSSWNISERGSRTIS